MFIKEECHLKRIKCVIVRFLERFNTNRVVALGCCIIGEYPQNYSLLGFLFKC